MLNKFVFLLIFPLFIWGYTYCNHTVDPLEREIGLILHSGLSHFQKDSVISQLSEDGLKLLIENLRSAKHEVAQSRVIVALHLAVHSNKRTMKFQKEILREYYRLIKKGGPRVINNILFGINYIADSNTIYHIIPLLYRNSGKCPSRALKALRKLGDTTHIETIMDALDKRSEFYPSTKKGSYLAMQAVYSIVRGLMIKKIQAQLSVETLVGKKQALQSRLDSISREEEVFKKYYDDFKNKRVPLK